MDWSEPARVLARRIRAFDPYPCAETTHAGATLKVWRAAESARRGEAGTVLGVDAAGVEVACGEAALVLQEVQRPGKRREPALAWARAVNLQPGDTLGVEM